MSRFWTEAPAGRVMIDGCHLEYVCHGPPPGDAPTIVLLHEGLGCVALWRDLPQQMSRDTGCGVLAYSRAGYGQSDPVDLPRPLDYMTREAEQVLGPLLDAFGLQQVILAGHSDGATIACIYAGSVSDLRVRGLILIAPHFFTEPAGLAAIAATGQAFEGGDLKARLSRYHSHPEVAFLGWHDAWTNPEFARWNVADCIDHLRIPVLAIQGDADAYGSLAQIAEIEERIYSPLETVILPGCGHAPQKERPDETRAAIREFCERLLRLEREDVRIG